MYLLRPASVLASCLILASGCAPEAARPEAPSATGVAPAAAPVAPATGVHVEGQRTDTAGSVAPAVTRVAQPVASASAPPVRPPLINGIPVVEPDYQAQAESVKEAVRTGRHPERLTPLVEPASFDRAAYRRDPGTYLDTVEPGRALQPGEPGPGVPDLAIVGADTVRVAELGSVVLAAQAVPRAPVSFTSMDMGAFPNGLTAITVQADDAGVARVQFTAIAGTVYESKVLVASPLAVHVRTFIVQIEPPADHHPIR